MRDTVEILGVNIDRVTFNEALDIAEGFVKEEGVSTIFTPNAEIVMCAQQDAELKEILNNADMCTADGIGVVYGSRILNNPLPQRVAGFDIVCSLLERLAKTGDGVFLFGAKPGVAETAKTKLEEKYPGILISGCRDGYFKPEDEEEIVQRINESGAKLLLVCLGAPKQEKWLHAHIDELDVGVAFGLGGSLDVFAGTVKRAPEFFQKHGIEWLYRLMKQPKRAIRMLDLPRFAIKVILKGRKFPQE